MSELPIQPIACVVGHPIAGNPMQFAVERAFAAADLDWRFLSLDVAPDRFEEAFRGIDALGFQGASIASPFAATAAGLVSRFGPIARRSQWVDCVSRDRDGRLTGHHLMARALADAVDLASLVSDHDEIPTAVFLGESTLGVAACHGLLGGPLAHWLVTDVEASAFEPKAGEAELGPTAAKRPEDANAPANDAKVTPAAGDTERSSSPAESKEQPQSPEESRAAVEFTAPIDRDRESPDVASESEPQRATGPTRVVRRVRSAEEAITEDTVLIIRGAMADHRPAACPEALLDRIERPAMVVDMAVAASTSTLARAAKQRGLQGITRLDLMIARTAMAMKLWTGEPADREILREAFEEYLEI